MLIYRKIKLKQVSTAGCDRPVTPDLEYNGDTLGERYVYILATGHICFEHWNLSRNA